MALSASALNLPSTGDPVSTQIDWQADNTPAEVNLQQGYSGFEAKIKSKIQDVYDNIKKALMPGTIADAEADDLAAFTFDIETLALLPFFEQEYQKLGRRKGAMAHKDCRNRVQRFWRESGDSGAAWLVQRLSRESRAEVLSDIAFALAEIGQPALKTILNTLEAWSSNVSVDQAETLLKAIGEMNLQNIDPSLTSRLQYSIRAFARNQNRDLREAAYGAALSFGPEFSHPLLRFSEAKEPDEELSELIAQHLRDSQGLR